MEIKLRGTAIACIAQEAILAGKAVKLTPDVTGNATGAYTSTNFNEGNIVIGAVLPSADDDTGAKYIAAFPVNNSKPPLYETLPTLDVGNSTIPYTFREYVAGTSNLPATGLTLRMVDPRLQEDQTIPSGTKMLAYDDGIYTVPSGCFYGTSFAVAQAISVKGTGSDRGKWYQGSGGRVASVFEYNSGKGKLTIKTECGGV